MERETLCRFLPKDKEPTWPESERMKYARFISENGDFEYRLVRQEKPVNAVLYLCIRQSPDAEMLPESEKLESEKQHGLRYCGAQGYRPLVLLESAGGDSLMEGKALAMILELAEFRLIDVVVLSHINNLFQFLDHASGILESIYRHDVVVDCVGCGILERGIFESYQRKSWRQERAFRVKLMGLVLSRKMKEQGDYSAHGVSAKILSRYGTDTGQAGDGLC